MPNGICYDGVQCPHVTDDATWRSFPFMRRHRIRPTLLFFVIKVCLEIPPTFGFALEELTRIEPLSATSSTWRLAGGPVAVVAVDSVGPIIQPHYWSIDAYGVFKILHVQRL